MNILFAVANDFQESTGSNAHVQEVVYELSELGHNLFVFCFGIPANGFDTVIPYIALTKKGPRLLQKLWFYLWSVLYVPYLIRKLNIDIVYTRIHMRFFAPVLSAWLTGIPLITEVNGYIPEELDAFGSSRVTKMFSRCIETLSYRRASRIVAVTEGIKRLLIRDYNLDPGKIVVIPNGVNDALFFPMNQDERRSVLGISNEHIMVLFLGYLARWQGVETLIRSQAEISRFHPHAHTYIVGSGPEENNLHELAAELGMNTWVHFIGPVPQASAVDYINASDICVAPFTKDRNSLIGLSPLKLYAYLACKRPVIASDIPGVGDFLRDSNGGIVIAPDDVGELSQAIRTLIEDQRIGERLAESGYKAVKEKHTWKKVAAHIDALLNMVK